MVLNIINKSPFSHSAFSECLAVLGDNDRVLLIEDGVYAAQADTEYAKTITALAGNNQFYILQADAQARGIADRINHDVQAVDYTQFVELTTVCNVVHSWY